MEVAALGDLRSKGAVVMWTGSDPTVMPVGLRGVAGDAQIQPPFTLPFRRGDHVLTVGWAILRLQRTGAAVEKADSERLPTPPL